MKNAAMIIVSAIMGFLILGIVLTIGGSMNRRCEVETILPSTMESPIIKFVGPAFLSSAVNLFLNTNVAIAIAIGGTIPPTITAAMML